MLRVQAGQGLAPGACFQRLAFGPGGLVAAAAPAGELHFLDARSGHLLEARRSGHSVVSVSTLPGMGITGWPFTFVVE